MKLQLAFLLLVSAVNCIPFNKDVVVVDTPTNRQREPGIDSFFREVDDDDDDDDVGGWGRPLSGFPFGFSENKFWQRFTDTMKKIQDQMNAAFNNPDFSGAPGIFDNLPPNYHNSTSETKNVNGTIITVNQTIDTHKDNNSQSVFHIKIVQVKPQKVNNETKTSSEFPEIANPEVTVDENEIRSQHPTSTPAEKVEMEISTPSDENNEP